MNATIQTKYGNIRISNGYYRISSKKERNYGKLLHRLIFEDFYGEIPEGFVVHHKDGNKLNNCILNLQLMKKSEHDRLHNEGDNNHRCWQGKHHSLETRKKISESKKGKLRGKEPKQTLINKSKSRNTTGFFKVIKQNKPLTKQGFLWIYHYKNNNKTKRLASTSLITLKTKVILRGLEWMIIDYKKAAATCNKYGYELNELI